MVEYSDRQARRANEIIEGLLGDGDPRFELEGELSIIDIERDANEFLNDLDLLSGFGARVPSLRIGDRENVPVALSLIGFPSMPIQVTRSTRGFWRRYGLPRSLRDIYRTLEDILSVEGFGTISHEEAQGTFVRRATNFLATRIAAIRDFNGERTRSFLSILQRSGGARISTPGCMFSVSSNSPGLRAFWSGAYYISGNYFGHPTPTMSVLQSGTYVFGVDGGAYGNVVQWDTSAVCSLPGKPSVHLNF
jgi:hypothetical protein